MPITQISSNFNAQIEALSGELATAATATQGQNQRQWMLPSQNGWGGSPLDIVGMELAFDRDDLNAQYGEAIATAGKADGGRLVDRMVSKAQVDYLGAMERAFRARHETPIRAAMFSAARMAGQGQATGVLRTVRDYLQTTLAQGYSVEAEPPLT